MNKRDIVIFIIVIGLVGYQFIFKTAVSIRANVLSDDILQMEPPKTSAFETIDIEAKAAFVWDARDDKVLYKKNENAQLPLASLTKVMTAYIVLEQGKSTTTVTRESVLSEGDSGLLVGEKWKTTELAKLTLVSSANDGAHSLATAWVGTEQAFDPNSITFIDEMNQKAKLLGLSQTYFLNETGLDLSSTTAGAYASANDVARLFYRTLSSYPEIFETTSSRQLILKSENKTHVIKNTNAGVESIPGIIASKTGYTPIAGGNLVVAIDAGVNHPIVAVVLGSSIEGRFSDMEKLLAATIDHVSGQ